MENTVSPPSGHQEWNREKIESTESEAFKPFTLTNNKPESVPEGSGSAVETVEAPQNDFNEGGGLKI
uniref:Uncharacterized protein n=1 Tax=Panagrolaimus sp. ES5 TaxID=591445 RepID=A0AC34FW67_9BILA